MRDGGLDIDLLRVFDNIAEADVITIYFPILGRTLIVDARRTEEVDQMVALVPIARGSADRYRSFRRLRPELPRPLSISMIPWTSPIDSLARLGIWPRILERLEPAGDDCDLRAQAAACLCELRELERRELLRAVRGHDYHTIWERSATERA